MFTHADLYGVYLDSCGIFGFGFQSLISYLTLKSQRQTSANVTSMEKELNTLAGEHELPDLLHQETETCKFSLFAECIWTQGSGSE